MTTTPWVFLVKPNSRAVCRSSSCTATPASGWSLDPCSAIATLVLSGCSPIVTVTSISYAVFCLKKNKGQVALHTLLPADRGRGGRDLAEPGPRPSIELVDDPRFAGRR